MKRIALALILSASFASAQVPLAPDAFSFTWTRQGTTGYADTNTWLSGVTYLLTNCIAMNGSNTQDLTNCGIVIRVGDTTTNRAFIGTIQNASNGTFACYFT